MAEEAKVEKAGEKRNRVAEFILTEHKFENYLLLFLGIFAIELGAILLTNFLTINEGAWLIGTQVGKTVFAWVLVGLGAVSVILVAFGFYRPSFDEIKNITGLKKKEFFWNVVKVVCFSVVIALFFVLCNTLIQLVIGWIDQLISNLK